MKISVPIDDFKSAMKWSADIAAKETGGALKFTVASNALTIESTNGQSWRSTSVDGFDGQPSQDGIRFILLGDRLPFILNARGHTAEISAEGGHELTGSLKVAFGRTVISLHITPPKPWNSVGGLSVLATVSRMDFEASMRSVKDALPKGGDATSEVLRCVNLSITDGRMSLMATNSYKAAMVSLPCMGRPTTESIAFYPQVMLTSFDRFSGASIQIVQNHSGSIGIQSGSTLSVGPVSGDKYPDVGTLISRTVQATTLSIEAEKDELIYAVKQCATGPTPRVEFHLTEDEITARNPITGDEAECIHSFPGAVDAELAGQVITFSSALFLSLISNVRTATVRFKIQNNAKAFILEEVETVDSPVRVIDLMMPIKPTTGK